MEEAGWGGTRMSQIFIWLESRRGKEPRQADGGGGGGADETSIKWGGGEWFSKMQDRNLTKNI
jgi:hypothetical protein